MCTVGSVSPRGWEGGDEELPLRDARVQVRHQRQDRHGQQGRSPPPIIFLDML